MPINLLLVRNLHVIRIRTSEFTKPELWNTAKCKTSSFELALPVSRIHIRINGSQCNEKCSVSRGKKFQELLDTSYSLN